VNGFRARFWAVIIGVHLTLGCEKPDAPVPEAARVEVTPPPVPLSAAFLTRALSALEKSLAEDTELLEIRASGRQFSIQIAQGETKKLEQIDYVEREMVPGQPPVGRLYGPVPVELRGQGQVADNLFQFSEVDLDAIARSFPTAQLAVDPDDGKVERLVVRRFLPFTEGLRARVYVYSPRMSGSIDTNENGVPLKR
jgi:hypothetical protein